MSRGTHKSTARIEMDARLLEAARRHRLDLAQLLEEAVSRRLAGVRWRERNGAAIEDYNRRVEEVGLFSDAHKIL